MTVFQDIPNANDIIAISQGDLKGNFEYINTTLSKEHQIAFGHNSGTAHEGRHTIVSMPNQLPAFPWPADANPTGFFVDSGGILQLVQQSNILTAFGGTPFAGGTPQASGTINPGYALMTGGAGIQWGSVAVVATPSPIIVTMSRSFASGPATSVSVTTNKTSVVAAVTAFPANNQFTISWTGPTTVTFYWMAIGH